MVISFVNQKGGVGKTTAAINLAISLKKKNYSLVFIDADPQGSAVQWHAIEGNKSLEILHHPSPIEATDIKQLSMNYDYVIIDAPPAIGDISKAILAATDLAIIPLSPSALDVWSCWGTMKMIDEIRPLNPEMEVKLLINRKIPGTRIGREARETMQKFQMDVFDTELCQRVAFIDAMTYGISVMQYAPHSKAAEEIEGLCEEIVLPDDVDSFKPNGGPVELGITSIDELGNESDMIKLMAPYQFSIPEAPRDLRIEKLEQFSRTHTAAFTESHAEEEEAIELLEAIASEQNHKINPSKKQKGSNGDAARIFD